MKRHLLIFFVVLFLITNINVPGIFAAAPEDSVRFAVVSDLHFYDASLGTTGSAFENYLTADRKMLAESKAIMDAAMTMIKQEAPQFLLIPGDLTKDGEKLNHQKVAEYLADMENSGIQVYVVPGNHDILNPHAVRFDDSTTTPVENITAEEFATIYADYGYNEALYRDTNSLSYIVEPVNGVWLFALDPCLYEQNTETSSVTSGGFSDEIVQWVQEKLQEAKTRGKYPIGMYHHASMEHYAGQINLWSQYILNDYQTTPALFAAGGMEMVFCGHFHAQDITVTEFDGKLFYDIMTGSLVTYPSPFRVVTIVPGAAVEIVSKFVQEIEYDTQGKTFPEYAHGFLVEGLHDLAMELLTAPPEEGGFGVSAFFAGLVAPLAVNAFAAHYSGDEMPTESTMFTINQFLGSGDPTRILMGQILLGMWTDLPPSDNNASLVLTSTNVAVSQPALVEDFGLLQNYPNPFNPETIISYTLPASKNVKIVVYDLEGREIATLVDAQRSAGHYSVVFDGRDLASGTYFYRLIVNGVPQVSRKMLLLK